MTNKWKEKTPEIALISYTEAPLPAEQATIAVDVLPARPWKFATVMLALALTGCTATLGTWLWKEQHQQESLQRELASLERLRQSDSEAWQESRSFFLRQLERQNAQLETLQSERTQMESALVNALTQPKREAAAPPRGDQQQQAADSQPATSAAVESVAEPDVTAAADEPVPASPELRRAMEASRQLQATNVAEAPTLEQIRQHVKEGNPAVVTNKEAAKAEKSTLARIFTHPIFIDSAVLSTSLLVPPSLPLTLAQSRLGRGLTRRVLKETDADKSVAGQVAQDVGNMPITRKRRK